MEKGWPRPGPAECARPSKGLLALICLLGRIKQPVHTAQPQGLAEFKRYAHSAGPGLRTKVAFIKKPPEVIKHKNSHSSSHKASPIMPRVPIDSKFPPLSFGRAKTRFYDIIP